ncbi:glycine betaine/L-proline ABC transporter permease ProW [Sulfurospirillum sp. 1612]|uniref:glycine betaine/L-proline ABC transporter permease ProW n=1 Tax=Sulfurospirillum sp. 1612 TaxID=3094835 RepID=UPI002F91C4E6
MSSNPWGTAVEQNSTMDWGQASQKAAYHFDISHPFKDMVLPLDKWVDSSLSWVVGNFRDFFQLAKVPVETILLGVQNFLLHVNPFIIVLFFALLAWQVSSKKMAFLTLLSFLALGFIGVWEQSMITLALVLTSVIFSMLLGLPLGILSAKSDRFDNILRPILDAMQTTPAFVYLIPIVMLFGIGNVPGVIVTIIFALPPLIRLTNLGIRQVPADLIEASRSFGASGTQMLFKVQLPVAMPTIMAGINQTLMLSLSMVVIASMIAVGGLGQMVLRGIGRLDIGLAAVGGLGIVLLAIVLDRLTQQMGKKDKKDKSKWYERGPVGLIYNLRSSK